MEGVDNEREQRERGREGREIREKKKERPIKCLVACPQALLFSRLLQFSFSYEVRDGDLHLLFLQPASSCLRRDRCAWVRMMDRPIKYICIC